MAELAARVCVLPVELVLAQDVDFGKLLVDRIAATRLSA